MIDAFSSALNGIQGGLSRLAGAAGSVRHATTEVAPPGADVAGSAVEARMARQEVAASVAVLRSADAMSSALVDILA